MGAKTTKEAPRNRTPGGGSFRIDRQFKRLGVGRLQVASGTTDPAEFERINALLTMLAEMDEKNLLRAVKDGLISIEDLRTAHKNKALPALREKVSTALLSEPAAHPTPDAPAPIRDRAGAVAAADLLEQPAVSHARPTARDSEERDTDDEDDREVLQRPFWPLLEDSSTWADSTTQPVTLQRYQQAIRACRLRLGLARLPVDQLKMLATLPPKIWDALQQVQRRGVSVVAARAFVKSGAVPRKHKLKKKRSGTRPYSMSNRRATAPPVSAEMTQTRLGHAAVCGLKLLLPEQWNVLESVDERMPTRAMVLGIVQLSDSQREDLTKLASILHRGALTQDVKNTRAVHWSALWAAWNGSPADWNHLRRAISAGLTCAFGFSGHTTRLKLMRRLTLKAESARVSDVSYETFERILNFVPVRYRSAYRTLVQTGLRVSEFVRLKPEHLNPRTRIVKVPGKKNDQSSRPIMVDAAFWPDLLEAVPCPISKAGLYQNWVTARKLAGEPDARQHDLRHSFGQWSLATGVHDSEVQEALRQKSSKVTADYRRLAQTEAASAGLAKAIRMKREAAAAVVAGAAEDDPLEDAESQPR